MALIDKALAEFQALCEGESDIITETDLRPLVESFYLNGFLAGAKHGFEEAQESCENAMKNTFDRLHRA